VLLFENEAGYLGRGRSTVLRTVTRYEMCSALFNSHNTEPADPAGRAVQGRSFAGIASSNPTGGEIGSLL
jgi:hypothetical protein